METQSLQVNVSIQIARPVAEVYEAITDPAHMSKYFISESTGRMKTGETLTWRIPEFDYKFPCTRPTHRAVTSHSNGKTKANRC